MSAHRFAWMVSLVVLGCGGVETPPETSTHALGVVAEPVIAANGGVSCTIVNGGLKCWGDNSLGQLGLGTSVPPECERDPNHNRALRCSMPVTVPGLASGVKGVAVGGRHTCALLTDGKVRCWGEHTYGEVGIGDPPVPCAIEGPNVVCTSPMTVGLPPAKAIASGWSHTCALLTDGTVRCWGMDIRGQLGNGDLMPPQCHDVDGFIRCTAPVAVNNLTNAKQLAAGDMHTCAVLTDGTLRCWGHHFYGALGIGWTIPPGCVPFGNKTDYCKEPVTVPNLPPTESVTAGGDHTCAVSSGAREVRCWGLNFDISLQLGSGEMMYGAVGVGATVPAGCTDYVGPGFSGPDGVADICYSAVYLPGLNGTTRVSAGATHTCGRLPSGQVDCWGSHVWGLAGVGDPPPAGCLGNPPGRAYCPAPVAVPGLPSVSSLSAGYFHSCAITPNATVCWGMNQWGQLGLGGSNPPGCDVSPYGTQYCTSPVIVLGL